MILSKLANLLSSSLTLGHSSSEVELEPESLSTTGTNYIPNNFSEHPSSKTLSFPLETPVVGLKPESRTETNRTTDVVVDPLKNFLDKLRLKELVYDLDNDNPPSLDNLPSTRFPLTYRPPPEGSRPLLYVMKLGPFLHDEVTYFFTRSATIKEKEQDILKLKLSLNYDSAAMTKAFGFNPYHIHNIQDVIYALERGPIRSAERLAKSINDTITDYHFMTSRGIHGHRINAIDPLLFTYLAYPNEYFPNEKSFVRCMLIPFAPWEFTSEDFIRFTSMGFFMDGPGHVDVTWSYILDTCVQTNCEYFILTTYDNWAFGRFSHTFSEAFISEPISNKADVLKYLTYWILTSCCTADTTDMDSTILKHRLEYELEIKENSGKRRKYGIQLISSKRVPDIVIKDFPIDGVYDYNLPEPIKEWNRWCKEDSDKKNGSSGEEVSGPQGVNERIEESVDDKVVENNETIGEEATGVGETDSKELTTGEGLAREEVDVTGEAGIGVVDSGGVGEDVNKEMEDIGKEAGEDINIEDDDASEHEVVLKLMESTIEETIAMDGETEIIQD